MTSAGPLRIGVLADLHLAEPGTPDGSWINTLPLGRSRAILRAALTRLADLGVDGLLLLGDLTQDGTEAQFEMLHAELEGFPAPYRAVLGNHDLGSDPSPLDLGTERRFPGVHLLAGTLAREGAIYRETAVPQASLWPPGLALWLTHFPLVDLRPALTDANLPHPGDLANRAAVLASLLARTDPTVVLAGHLHVRAATHTAAVLHLNHASLIEPPHEVTVLELDTAATPLRTVRTSHSLAPAAPLRRLPALTPARQEWTFRKGRWEERSDAAGPGATCERL